MNRNKLFFYIKINCILAVILVHFSALSAQEKYESKKDFNRFNVSIPFWFSDSSLFLGPYATSRQQYSVGGAEIEYRPVDFIGIGARYLNGRIVDSRSSFIKQFSETLIFVKYLPKILNYKSFLSAFISTGYGVLYYDYVDEHSDIIGAKAEGGSPFLGLGGQMFLFGSRNFFGAIHLITTFNSPTVVYNEKFKAETKEDNSYNVQEPTFNGMTLQIGYSF
jgi:hypothetical protein